MHTYIRTHKHTNSKAVKTSLGHRGKGRGLIHTWVLASGLFASNTHKHLFHKLFHLLCGCTHVWRVHIFMHVCTCLRRPEHSVGCLPHSCSTSFLKPTVQDSPISDSPVLESKAHTAMLGFYVSSGNQICVLLLARQAFYNSIF